MTNDEINHRIYFASNVMGAIFTWLFDLETGDNDAGIADYNVRIVVVLVPEHQ